MAFLRRISDLFFGERGATDVAATRTASGVLFRLPGQYPSWGAQGAVFVLLAMLGAFAIFLVVNGFWRFGPEAVANWCIGPTIVLVIGAMILLVVRMRIQWRYEIEANPRELCVYYVAVPQRVCVARIDMTPVRQLTIVRKENKSLLQAEGDDGTVRLIIRQQDHGMLVRLARMLAAEQANGELRVAIEDPAHVQPDRSEAPVSCKINLTRHETGVSFDFPLAPDPRDKARTRAWILFEIGIITLISTLIVYVFFQVYQLKFGVPLLLLPFIAGLVCLATASGQSWKAWLDHSSDADLRQLNVAGNMLIRTARDHHKQIWYREEVRFLGVVERAISLVTGSSEGNDQVSIVKVFQLIVEANDQPPTVLHQIDADAAQADYRPKAELEWMATELRNALFQQPAEAPVTPHEASQAIQAQPHHIPDERITHDPT